LLDEVKLLLAELEEAAALEVDAAAVFVLAALADTEVAEPAAELEPVVDVAAHG
jgi:hypothetical protein